jgi:hypothetical protein
VNNNNSRGKGNAEGSGLSGVFLPLSSTADAYINPILHTAWLESHALTLKNNTAKYYFGEKSSFLHTFLKFSLESRTIQVNF